MFSKRSLLNRSRLYGSHIIVQGDMLISDKTLFSTVEPSNYKEAMLSPEVAKWKECMESLIQSMYDVTSYLLNK